MKHDVKKTGNFVNAVRNCKTPYNFQEEYSHLLIFVLLSRSYIFPVVFSSSSLFFLLSPWIPPSATNHASYFSAQEKEGKNIRLP